MGIGSIESGVKKSVLLSCVRRELSINSLEDGMPLTVGLVVVVCLIVWVLGRGSVKNGVRRLLILEWGFMIVVVLLNAVMFIWSFF